MNRFNGFLDKPIHYAGAIRVILNITLDELAEEMKISTKQLSRIERKLELTNVQYVYYDTIKDLANRTSIKRIQKIIMELLSCWYSSRK